MTEFQPQSKSTEMGEARSPSITPVLSQMSPSQEYSEYKVISVPQSLHISEMLTNLSSIDHDQGISDLEVQSVMCQENDSLLPSMKRICSSRSSSSGKSSSYGYSPMKPNTALTNTKRGNTLTVTPTFPLDLPIHQLAAQGELAKLTEKLDNGYEPDELDPEGLTPVHWACAHGQKDAVHLLVEKGGDINKKGRDAESSISFACCNGNKDLVKYLLDEKVEFDSHDWNGGTPLLYAVANNHPQCVELLLQAGADITAESESGHNALALAIAKGHVKVQKKIERHMLGLLAQ
ncbi:uncharacterized protein [Apostichopus japonicus]|uniref:uncharacterized protein n=1 Tax=Stichopus japonicus TaxID=307972 RepID=UPI003AB13E3D